MSFKEHLKGMFKSFFIITTLVNFAMFILGTIYRGDVLLPYNAFLYPPLYGLFGVIPELLLFSKKELSAGQLLIRKIFQLLALEILLIFLTFYGSNMVKEDVSMIVSFAISVFVIYVLVNVITWFFDKRKAAEMMKDIEYLKEMQ